MILGEQTHIKVDDFGDRISQKLLDDDVAKSAAYEKSGLISAGKLGKPSLWAILSILGVPDTVDPYLLGKFRRGDDVEARAINFLTDLPINLILDIIEGRVENPGWLNVGPNAVIKGEVYLQMPTEYRGGVGYIDIGQRSPAGTIILHEIKSATKLAYDKVAATGRSAFATAYVDGEKTKVKNYAAPYEHHAIQLAFYGLGEGIHQTFLHYFNADDYRLTSFAINPLEYKEEIDSEMDAIQGAFENKVLPTFEPFLGWHKAYQKTTYGAFNQLGIGELLPYLKTDFPDAYETFMKTELPTGKKVIKPTKKTKSK